MGCGDRPSRQSLVFRVETFINVPWFSHPTTHSTYVHSIFTIKSHKFPVNSDENIIFLRKKLNYRSLFDVLWQGKTHFETNATQTSVFTKQYPVANWSWPVKTTNFGTLPSVFSAVLLVLLHFLTELVLTCSVLWYIKSVECKSVRSCCCRSIIRLLSMYSQFC